MSKIAGFCHTDGRNADLSNLEKMTRTMAHPGPDSAGTFCEGQAGFSYQPLATVSHALPEHFPLVDREAQLVLTADAVLYNRKELIDTLDIAELPLNAVLDGHLILASFRKWGDTCVDHLVGDFAFALWDIRGQRLFCARDHFGARPFYYYLKKGSFFAFASAIKALLCLPGIPRKLNDERMADYLLDMVDDHSYTFWEQIFRLPPAHCLTIANGSMNIRRYWAPDPVKSIHLTSDEAYGEAFLELFTRAVNCRLSDSSSTGVLLSGGIDSSAVASVAARCLADQGKSPLHAFSLLYDGAPTGDERDYIRSVTELDGIVSHTIKADGISFLSGIEPLFFHFDEPYDNPHYPVGWALWQAVGKQKIPVLLDGVDGDTAVSYHHTYLCDLARTGCWITLARECVGLSRNVFNEQVSALSLMWQRGILPCVTPLSAWVRNALNRPWMLRQDSMDLINPDLAERVDLPARLAQKWHDAYAFRNARQYHCYEVTHGVMACAMESLNKMASAAGVEPRHPFFDKRLVEFCVSLPREQKVKNGWTRTIVRRALKGIIPEKIRLRGGKWGPSPYFANALSALDGDRLTSLLHEGLAPVAPYVNPARVKAMLDRYHSEPNANDAHTLCMVAVLALWMEKGCTHLTSIS